MAALDFLVKLGGSAITHKEKLETINAEAFAAAVEDICAVSQLGSIVVVHGAGSFGHFQAKQYKISTGTSHADAALGIALTRASVCALNLKLVAALCSAGVPAVGVSPCGSWTTKGRKVACAPFEHISALLSLGCVPVVHGDVVVDESQGVAVLGGDVLMSAINARLRPRRAVFVSDVDGVYTKPPGQAGAVLLRRLLIRPAQTVGDVLAGVSITAASHDVTGGLVAKVESAMEIVRAKHSFAPRDDACTTRSTLGGDDEAKSSGADEEGGSCDAPSAHAPTICSVVSCASHGVVDICKASTVDAVLKVHGTHFVAMKNSPPHAPALP